jgi:ABC-type transport system involved in multi-copper enzyme maturation permease subunit
MRAIRIICWRELVAYFTSPVAYVFLVIFLLLAGFFTFTAGAFFERGEASLSAFFGWHPWLYLVLVPAVVDTVASFSVITHFDGFQKGVLDTRDLFFFLSVIGFALFATGVIIRGHRAG